MTDTASKSNLLMFAAYPAMTYSPSLAALRAAILNDQFLESRLNVKCLVLPLIETDLAKRWVGVGSNDFVVLVQDVLKFNPDIVGVSCYPWNFRLCEALLTALKQIDLTIVTVAGGPSACLLQDSSACDIVFYGEGEERFPDLLRVLVGARDISRATAVSGLHVKLPAGPIQTDPPGRPPELAALPSGVLTTEVLPEGRICIETSRGCPFRCVFCSWGKGSKLRFVPAERVLRELAVLCEANVEQVQILDSAFNADHQRCDAFLLELIRRNNGTTQYSFELMLEQLRPSTARLIGQLASMGGIAMCGVGLQTIDPLVSAAIRRPLHLHRVRRGLALLRGYAPAARVAVDIMFGLPGDSLASVLETLEFCVINRCYRINLFRCMVSPGSPIFQDSTRFEVAFDRSPPFFVLGSQTFSRFDMASFSVFALLWPKVACAFPLTLECVSRMSNGRAVALAWSVFCRDLNARPRPRIGIEGWDLNAFLDQLIEEYRQIARAVGIEAEAMLEDAEKVDRAVYACMRTAAAGRSVVVVKLDESAQASGAIRVGGRYWALASGGRQGEIGATVSLTVESSSEYVDRRKAWLVFA